MHILRVFFLALALASPMAGNSAHGDVGSDPNIRPKYRELFNGRDLSGWRLDNEVLTGKTGSRDGRFHVVDGVIVVNPGHGQEVLYTTQSFNRDFLLRLEFRASRRADSGVFIRGVQLQVRDYPTVGPYAVKDFRSGDWNDLEVIVRGTAAHCVCAGTLLEKAMIIPKNGAIGLQAETGKFEYRRIRIRDLQ